MSEYNPSASVLSALSEATQREIVGYILTMPSEREPCIKEKLIPNPRNNQVVFSHIITDGEAKISCPADAYGLLDAIHSAAISASEKAGCIVYPVLEI